MRIRFKKYSFPWFSIAIGIVVGLCTVFGQKYLLGALNSLANSGAMWMIPAFYIACIYRKQWKSALASVIYLLACVVTYYGYYAIFWHYVSIGFYPLFWAGCALLFGTIFGLGANYAKYGKGFFPYLCKMLLPAIFLSEGLMELSHYNDYRHMTGAIIIWLVIGFILYIINSGKESLSKNCLLAILIMTGLGFAGYQLLYYVLT